MTSLLKNLNEKQKEAVQATEGPVLIIAGPGSGKTQVLTHRIAYLIKEKNIDPKNILAVTFTNKAAEEMRQRVFLLLSDFNEKEKKQKLQQAGVSSAADAKWRSPSGLGTFHSVCARILRYEIDILGFKKNFTIYDKNDQLSLIKETIKNLEIDPEQFRPQSALAAIGSAKNELIGEKKYAEQAKGYFQENIYRIYSLYQKKLKEANALDFDDLISHTVFIFKKFPDILKKYQNRFRYILIDEYQDTNFSQYTLARMLAEERKNICAVGDDWQSIYSFRGADIRNILEFERDWPEAKVIMLERSYRSTQNILDAASKIISKNTRNKDKKLWTEKSGGEQIVVFEAENEIQEAEFIVSEIENLINPPASPMTPACSDTAVSGRKPLRPPAIALRAGAGIKRAENSALTLNDFTVLYRVNAQSRAVEEVFLKRNIAYKIIGGLKFYGRKEIKDLIAYLKIIENPNDIVSLQRIINVPPRGIGKVTLKKILEGDTTSCRLQGSPKILSSFNNFNRLISDCRKMSQEIPLSKLLKFILEQSGYKKYIQDKTIEGQTRWENIEELLGIAKEFNNLNPQKALREFLEKVALASDADEVEDKKELVNLMTLHAAKGLEFSVVFIIGLEEGLLPHSRSIANPNEIEEERRLCYVGITRAKEKVYLTFTRTRNFHGSRQANLPSRFLRDIPEELVDYQSQ